MVGRKTSSRMNGGSEMSTQIYLFKGDGGAGLFLRLKEPVQVGASSSEVPRLHPDVIQWNPPEQEQPLGDLQHQQVLQQAVSEGDR